LAAIAIRVICSEHSAVTGGLSLGNPAWRVVAGADAPAVGIQYPAGGQAGQDAAEHQADAGTSGRRYS
jgi:hypothetical protein